MGTEGDKEDATAYHFGFTLSSIALNKMKIVEMHPLLIL